MSEFTGKIVVMDSKFRATTEFTEVSQVSMEGMIEMAVRALVEDINTKIEITVMKVTK